MSRWTIRQVDLPCGCSAEADHLLGERLVRCREHNRSFVVKALAPVTNYTVREMHA